MEKEGKERKIKETEGKNPIAERIYSKAAEIGISRGKLAKKVGIAKNTLANWSARNSMPPADTALAIADELRCSVRWLITGVNDKQEEYSLEEKNLINRFRNLDRQGQFEVKALLEAKAVPVGKETIPEIISVAEKKQAAS